jgi:hypothetical protein
LVFQLFLISSLLNNSYSTQITIHYMVFRPNISEFCHLFVRWEE